MENFPIEQSESEIRQEKFNELEGIMNVLSESFKDSNDADEVQAKIDNFKKSFESEGLNLEDYSLSKFLLSPKKSFDLENDKFDTEDHMIENFIKGLNNEESQNSKAA